MSNIPAVTGKKIISVKKQVGFSIARIKESHHFLIYPDGRITVISIYGKETIGRGLFPQILRNCELNIN